MSLRKLYYSLNPELRLLARKLVYLPGDFINSLLGKGGSMVPPKGDIYVGPGNFSEIGANQLRQLRKYLGLATDDAVLDIGSGIGRTAVPLTSYLSERAIYEGFDVVEKGVEWCREHISLKHPNFRFTYVALYNDLYNESTDQARDFRFPYATGCFDKAFLFSVFTHMMVDEIHNYLAEIDRVLNADGSCLATFFLYNNQNKDLISAQSGFNFPWQYDGYRLLDHNVRSANIAISEHTLLGLLEGKNLVVHALIEGFWKEHVGKTGTNDFQDIVIFQRNHC